MKILIGLSLGGLDVKPGIFGKSTDVVRDWTPGSCCFDGVDVVMAKADGFFAGDLTDRERVNIAVDSAMRFAVAVMDADVRLGIVIASVAYPVEEIRRAFPEEYVSEHAHYVEPVRKDADLKRPFAHRWTHVWNRRGDYNDAERHQHLFFFHDPHFHQKDQPSWVFFLQTARAEIERARDASTYAPITD